MSNNSVSLDLEIRTIEGKKVYKLRKDDIVPGVVYGDGIKPTNVQVPLSELSKVIKQVGKHTPLNITLNKKKSLALIKTISYEPAKHLLQNVAFQIVNQNEKVETEVPIKLIGLGKSPAEKLGLIIMQAIESIAIKAKPADLVNSLEVSVEQLADADDKILLKDVKLPKGIEYADADQDMELAVANVYEPGKLEAENAVSTPEAAPAAAPEAIPAAGATKAAPEATPAAGATKAAPAKSAKSAK